MISEGVKIMKNSFVYTDKWIFFSILFLLMFSNLMIFSTWTIQAGVYQGGSILQMIIKQVAFLVAGLILYFITYRIKYRVYMKMSNLIWFFVGCLLVYVLSTTEINSSRSWISLGFINIQPSELAKLSLILVLATYYDKFYNGKVDRNFKSFMLYLLFYIFTYVVLIVIQPDPGTALVILITAVVMFLGARVPWKLKFKAFMGTLALLVVLVGTMFVFDTLQNDGENGFVSSQSRAISRFDNFDKPCDDFSGQGYQVCNSLIAINIGGVFGVGLGNSTQKYTYLPEAHTDAIIAVTAEELGLIAVLVIIVLYFILIFRIMLYAMRVKTVFGSLFCLGTAFLFFAHFFINMAGITNIIPLTGIPLPFLSYGGSFLLVSFMLVGVVQSIAAEYNIDKITE